MPRAVGGPRRTCLASGLALSIAWVLPAAAQDDLRQGIPVQLRERKELDPVGLRLGGFILYPKFDLGEAYDDNVLRSPRSKKADFVTLLGPDVALLSQWSRHSLSLRGYSRIGLHRKESREDYTDAGFIGEGVVDFTQTLSLKTEAQVDYGHEERRGLNDLGGSEPTRFIKKKLDSKLVRKGERITFELGARLTDYSYFDTPTPTGPLLGVDRDRLQREAYGRIAYQYDLDLSDRVSWTSGAFVAAIVNDRTYARSRDSSGFLQDSAGYDLRFGSWLDFGVTSVSVYAGVIRQRYDERRFKTTEGLNFGGTAHWQPTRLTSVQAEISRTVEETQQVGVGGALVTSGSVEINHELRRNVILTAAGKYAHWDFPGLSRTEDQIELGLSGLWIFARSLAGKLSYRYTDRTTRGVDNGFVQNRFTIGIEVRF